MTANCCARQGLLATAAGMLWGTVGIASKLLPDGVTLSPFHLGFARLAIAAPLLTLFSALVLGRALWAIPTPHTRMAMGRRRRRTGSLLSALSIRELGAARCRADRPIDGLSAARADRRRVRTGQPPATVGLDPGCPHVGAWRPDAGGGGGSNTHSPVSDAVPLLGLAVGTLAAIAFALLSALARMLAGRIHPSAGTQLRLRDRRGSPGSDRRSERSRPASSNLRRSNDGATRAGSRLSRRRPHRARVHLLFLWHAAQPDGDLGDHGDAG